MEQEQDEVHGSEFRLLKAYIRRLHIKVVRHIIRMRFESGIVPNSLAFGAAVGFSPTVGAQLVLLGILAAAAFAIGWRKFDLILAGLATFVVNPVTMVPTYTAYYFIGCGVLDCAGPLRLRELHSFEEFLNLGTTTVSAIALGSIPFMIVGIYGGLRIGRLIETVLRRRSEKKRKRLKELARSAAPRSQQPESGD